MDVPAGVTQEEGHRGFFHLPSAVLALIFISRRIQPFISLVDREVDIFFKIPVRVAPPRFELTSLIVDLRHGVETFGRLNHKEHRLS